MRPCPRANQQRVFCNRSSKQRKTSQGDNVGELIRDYEAPGTGVFREDSRDVTFNCAALDAQESETRVLSRETASRLLG
jgi:hypothetical protein